MRTDIRIENHGTIFLFRPITAVARAWIDEHVQSEPWQWYGNALGVDHRMILDLVEGAREEGLVVR